MTVMKKSLGRIALILLVIAGEAGAAEPLPKDDLAAIREESRAFVTSFNSGDAHAVAAMWTEDGDYTNESGEAFQGRDAIEREYAAFFAANPGVKLKLTIDSIKRLSADTAIEDGRASLDPATAGPPATSRYMAIHVRVEGKWLMSSVRDTRVETPSGYRRMDDFEWLVGTWVAEEHGAKSEFICRWVANKSFVERSFTTALPNGATTSGVQLIGRNPESGQIQSWTFSSDGGLAIGVWSVRANGWTAEVRGVTDDGIATTAVNLLTKLDDDAYTWQSVMRSVGGEALPDIHEIVLKRKRQK
jgi:uncharacterized protein (TIGR02246 family)